MATRIKKVSAKNLRGFKILNIAPSGLFVKMLGPNGAGKTDALFALMAPVEPNATDGAPVTYGEPSGSVELELQTDTGRKLLVERTWRTTKAGTQVTDITVKQVDGEDLLLVSNVKAFLEKLFGPFTDVRRFLDVRTPKQERELGDALLASASVDVKGMDEQLEALTAEKKTNKATLTSTQARLTALTTPRPGLPAKEESIAGKAAEIAAWREEAHAYQAAASKLKQAETSVEDAAARVARLKKELATAESEQKAVQKALDAGRKAFEKIPAPPTAEQIAEAQTEMGTLEQTNAEVRRAMAWRELVGEVEALEKTDAAFVKSIEDVRATKLKALREAKLPIEGLAITEEGTVMYEGVGLHELSEGQKLVVGVAIALATMASVQAIFVDGGESIDKKNEDKAVAMCTKAGVQLWMAETAKEAPELVIRGADATFERAGVAA